MPGVKRTILSQMDGPMPGYVTINMEVEIDPGVTVGRHTHPGIESSYVLEGGFELPGVAEDGMSGKNGQQKPGTARGSPRRSRTAKASHISRRAVKLRCACEWGG